MTTATMEHQPSIVINRLHLQQFLVIENLEVREENITNTWFSRGTFPKNDDSALLWKLREKIVQDQEHLCSFLSCAVLGVDTQLLSDKVTPGVTTRAANEPSAIFPQ